MWHFHFLLSQNWCLISKTQCWRQGYAWGLCFHFHFHTKVFISRMVKIHLTCLRLKFCFHFYFHFYFQFPQNCTMPLMSNPKWSEYPWQGHDGGLNFCCHCLLSLSLSLHTDVLFPRWSVHGTGACWGLNKARPLWLGRLAPRLHNASVLIDTSFAAYRSSSSSFLLFEVINKSVLGIHVFLFIDKPDCQVLTSLLSLYLTNKSHTTASSHGSYQIGN